MASGDPSDGKDNRGGPRMPKNMKGLMRLCAETASQNPSEEPINFQPMDPEVIRKKIVFTHISFIQSMKNYEYLTLTIRFRYIYIQCSTRRNWGFLFCKFDVFMFSL